MRLFSNMKQIKTRFCNLIGEQNLSNLMSVITGSPKTLVEKDLKKCLVFGKEKLKDFCLDNFCFYL